jgi:hypothetical protein
MAHSPVVCSVECSGECYDGQSIVGVCIDYLVFSECADMSIVLRYDPLHLV